MGIVRDILGGDRVHRIIKEQRAQRSPGRSPGAPGLNCLVLGGGGREYAIAWRLARDQSVATIDVTPGNAGMPLFTRILDFPPDDLGRLEQHIVASHIDLAIVGPDDLVAKGIGQALGRGGISSVGPSREAAKVEWSKSYAKELMAEAGVPTARAETFADAPAQREGLERWGVPVVLKADGLASGKGVLVARTLDGREQLADARGRDPCGQPQPDRVGGGLAARGEGAETGECGGAADRAGREVSVSGV